MMLLKLPLKLLALYTLHIVGKLASNLSAHVIGLFHAGHLGLRDLSGLRPGMAECGDPVRRKGDICRASILRHVSCGTGWRVGW